MIFPEDSNTLSFQDFIAQCGAATMTLGQRNHVHSYEALS
jgi:hypothetical protein